MELLQDIIEQLKKHLHHFYSGQVFFGNEQLNNRIEIDYLLVKEDVLQIKVRSEVEDEIVLEVILDGELYFLDYPVVNVDNIPSQLLKLLGVVSIPLSKRSLVNSVNLLILAISSSVETLSPDAIVFVVNRIREVPRLDLLDRLVRSLVPDYFLLIQIIHMVLASDDQVNFVSRYQEVLESIIESNDGRFNLGKTHYNLANSYRSTSNFYDAYRNYILARKKEPIYDRQPYWWKELASIMFLTNHFHFAELFYLKSYEIYKDYDYPNILSLIGDSQFYQGKFQKAADSFSEYFNAEGSTNIPEYKVKEMAARQLTAEGFDSLNFDRSKALETYEKALLNMDIKLLDDSLRYCPINLNGWYLLGINYAAIDLQKAFNYFLISSCMNMINPNSWRNCFIIAFNSYDTDLVGLVLSAALDKLGNGFINFLSEDFQKDTNLTEEQKQKYLNYLKNFDSIGES